jgi:hypothetical protein
LVRIFPSIIELISSSVILSSLVNAYLDIIMLILYVTQLSIASGFIEKAVDNYSESNSEMNGFIT